MRLIAETADARGLVAAEELGELIETGAFLGQKRRFPFVLGQLWTIFNPFSIIFNPFSLRKDEINEGSEAIFNVRLLRASPALRG